MAPLILTSALDGGERPTSLRRRIADKEPGVPNRIERRVGPTACLVVLEKRKIPRLCQDSNPGSSGQWPSH